MGTATLRSAQTPSELEMITHDLAYREQTWSTYTPPTDPHRPWPTDRRRRRRRRFEFEFDDPTIEFPEYDGPPAAPQLFRARDFNAMRAAVRRQTGSTQAFRAVIYPGYASLELPAERTGQRARSYFYDGDLGEPSNGRSTNERFDLASIDPEVMTRLVRKAKTTLVEDPIAWYVIIERPGPTFDDGGWITVHASNDFDENGFLEATLDGTIVNRSVSE